MLHLPYTHDDAEGALARFEELEAGPRLDPLTAYMRAVLYPQAEQILQSLIADLSGIVDGEGACLIMDGAHGYEQQVALLQQRDRRYTLFYCNDLAPTATVQHLPSFALDLPAALRQLREDGTITRGVGNRNIDQRRGYEGPHATLYLAVRTDSEWVHWPKPMLGGLFRATIPNQLYCAMHGLQDEISLQ